jgi:hypothetical protein
MWLLSELLKWAPSPTSYKSKSLIILLLNLLTLSGCVTDQYCIPTGCSGPERLLPVNQELEFIAVNYGYSEVLSRYLAEPSLDGKKAIRNEFIFERIYAMDVKYTFYEDSLTKESQSEGFWAAVTNAALTGTGALIPVAQTTRLLSGIAAGLTTVDQAYNKQFLYNKAVQILQAQMRAKRADVQSQIVVRARFPVTEYPLGMAMIDLEEYYRAGTLSSAFVDLSESIGTDANSKRKVKELLKGGVVISDTGIKVQVKAGPITSVNEPLSTPIRSRAVLSSTRLTDFEANDVHQKGFRLVRQILCLDGDGDLGPANSVARLALARFLAANGKPPSQVIDPDTWFNILELKRANKRNC